MYTGMSFEHLEAGRQPLTLAGTGTGTARGRLQQDPSQAAAAGVFQINTAVSSFQRLANSLGTPKDTLDLRHKLLTGQAQSKATYRQLVKETSAKLKQVSETDQLTEVSASKKIAGAKLAKDFQTVLKEFQKAQRLAAERETSYAPFIPKEVLPSSEASAHVEIRSSESPEQISLLIQSRRQEVGHLENEIVFNEAIIEEREQGIKEIQRHIGVVNEIFKDLEVSVHDQGVIIGYCPTSKSF